MYVNPVGKRRRIGGKTHSGEKLKKRCKKNFRKKNKNISCKKKYGQKKIKVGKKNFFLNFFCFKKYKNKYCETKNQYLYNIFGRK